MKTIDIGNKKISRIMLGTAQLGLEYGIANKTGKPNLEKSFEIIDASVSGGITCLDTAADYGDSERVIGEYLRSRKENKKKLFIVTKFKFSEERGNIEEIISKKVEQSCINLGVDSLDLLLLHDAREYSINPVQIDKTLEKLINKGMIKRVGASTYDYKDIETMVNNDLYEAFQMPMNMMDHRLNNEKIVSKLEKKLIFTRSVYFQGLFFKKPTELTGNLEVTREYVKTIQDIAKEMNISVAKLAMGYVNSLPYVDSLVIGAETSKQVIENIALVNNSYITEKEMKSIQDRLKGAPEWIFYPWLWKL